MLHDHSTWQYAYFTLLSASMNEKQWNTWTYPQIAYILKCQVNYTNTRKEWSGPLKLMSENNQQKAVKCVAPDPSLKFSFEPLGKITF